MRTLTSDGALAVDEAEAVSRWGGVEWLLVIVFLSPGLVYLPGTGPFRMVIRAMPYIASLAVFLAYAVRPLNRRRAPGAGLLIGVLWLLGVQLLHPGTNVLAGMAQWVYQLSIMAPVFWVARAVRTTAHLRRILVLIFGLGMAHTVMAVLQAYDPVRFMPPDLRIVEGSLSALTYIGPFGQEMIRPPGLSDLPGGAVFGAVMALLLGIALTVDRDMPRWRKLLLVVGAVLGLFTAYLTQVRAMALVAVAAIVIFALLVARLREGRVVAIGTIGGVVSLVFFIIGAGAIAGDNHRNPLYRFRLLFEEGLIESFMDHRGTFIASTFETLLPRYPFGAGLGRWGIMRDYFAISPNGNYSPAIWVEVQITGWLVDGGILMWILYGGAIGAALVATYAVARSRTDPRLAVLGATVLAVELFLVGTCLAGPTFNLYNGMVFWILAAGLHGAARGAFVRKGEAAVSVTHLPDRSTVTGAAYHPVRLSPNRW